FKQKIKDFENSIQQYMSQFLNIDQQRETTFISTQNNREQIFANQISQIKQSWEETLEQYDLKFNMKIDEINQLKEEQTEQFENLFELISQKSQTVISSLEKAQEKSKNILGTLSVDSHAAGYQREADKAYKAKIIWQTITG